ncbi:MAG: GNAT family N-acetyltransferase [Ketobacter sp.]|nr:GNAT family N-acetyltransferase [Ketobacter sp.]
MIRNLASADYEFVIERVNDWWGGREVKDMLPRLFFDHFSHSSFGYVLDGRLVGFVVGFLSPVHPDTAYIHFTGVDPEFREKGIASAIYKVFIDFSRSNNCKYVKCVTSPSNSQSLSYHQAMGFRASKYDSEGLPLGIKNYDGSGNDRVLLVLKIGT